MADVQVPLAPAVQQEDSAKDSRSNTGSTNQGGLKISKDASNAPSSSDAATATTSTSTNANNKVSTLESPNSVIDIKANQAVFGIPQGALPVMGGPDLATLLDIQSNPRLAEALKQIPPPPTSTPLAWLPQSLGGNSRRANAATLQQQQAHLQNMALAMSKGMTSYDLYAAPLLYSPSLGGYISNPLAPIPSSTGLQPGSAYRMLDRNLTNIPGLPRVPHSFPLPGGGVAGINPKFFPLVPNTAGATLDSKQLQQLLPPPIPPSLETIPISPNKRIKVADAVGHIVGLPPAPIMAKAMSEDNIIHQHHLQHLQHRSNSNSHLNNHHNAQQQHNQHHFPPPPPLTHAITTSQISTSTLPTAKPFIPLTEAQVFAEIDKLFDMDGVVTVDKIGVPPPLLKQASEPDSSILVGAPFEYQLQLAPTTSLISDLDHERATDLPLAMEEEEQEKEEEPAMTTTPSS